MESATASVGHHASLRIERAHTEPLLPTDMAATGCRNPRASHEHDAPIQVDDSDCSLVATQTRTRRLSPGNSIPQSASKRQPSMGQPSAHHTYPTTSTTSHDDKPSNRTASSTRIEHQVQGTPRKLPNNTTVTKQPRPLSLLQPREEGLPTLRHTQQGLMRLAPGLSCSAI